MHIYDVETGRLAGLIPFRGAQHGLAHPDPHTAVVTTGSCVRFADLRTQSIVQTLSQPDTVTSVVAAADWRVVGGGRVGGQHAIMLWDRRAAAPLWHLRSR